MRRVPVSWYRKRCDRVWGRNFKFWWGWCRRVFWRCFWVWWRTWQVWCRECSVFQELYLGRNSSDRRWRCTWIDARTATTWWCTSVRAGTVSCLFTADPRRAAARLVVFLRRLFWMIFWDGFSWGRRTQWNLFLVRLAVWSSCRYRNCCPSS